jgi:hypothetical protein
VTTIWGIALIYVNFVLMHIMICMMAIKGDSSFEGVKGVSHFKALLEEREGLVIRGSGVELSLVELAKQDTFEMLSNSSVNPEYNKTL